MVQVRCMICRSGLDNLHTRLKVLKKCGIVGIEISMPYCLMQTLP